MSEPPTEGVQTWLALMQAQAAVLDAVQDEVEPEIGMPLAWLEVLHRLDGAPDEQLRMQDLARSVLLTRSGLTRLADRLERDGLIQRCAVPADRRGAFARLTDAGRIALDRGRPIFRAAVERHIAAHLTPAQQRTLRTALDTLTAANPSDRVPCHVLETDKSVDDAATVAGVMR